MARMNTSARAHQPEALSRSGFQPYRPDERSANAAAAAAAAAGVYPPLDVFQPFNTMPLPAGMCYIGIFSPHLKLSSHSLLIQKNKNKILFNCQLKVDFLIQQHLLITNLWIHVFKIHSDQLSVIIRMLECIHRFHHMHNCIIHCYQIHRYRWFRAL